MTTVTLGDAIELAYGKSLPVRTRRDGSIPVYGSNGVVGFHDEALVPKPTVIVGRKGSVGAVHLVSGPSFPIDTTYFVRPKAGVEIDIRYTAYALKHLDLSRLRTETGVPGLNREDAYREPFSLPPLDEQRRIVDILNRAARIEALRTQAAERLRDFVPALFVKMFGDPVENPMGWQTERLGSLGSLDRGRSRHRPRNAPELYGGPYPFVQTGDIANSNGLVTQYSQTYSETGLNQSKMWPSGTLCITIAANIGMTGILTFDSCFPDSIVGFQPGGTVTVEYVQTAVDLMQSQIEEDAPRAAQRNINLGVLRELTIPTPPFALQRQYAEIVAAARAITHVREFGTKVAASLTASLMFRWLESDLPRHQTNRS